MKLGIFNMEQDYNSDFESLCRQNCMLQIFDYYGVKHPFIYLDASLGAHLFESKENIGGYEMRIRQKPLIEEYNQKTCTHTPICKNGDYQEGFWKAWEENKQRLKEGIPVIAETDVFYLDYSKENSRYHSNHSLIVCGYSEDEKYVTVIDWYTWKYKGDFSMEKFNAARTSKCPWDDSPYSGQPIENIWMEMEKSDWQGTPEELLGKTIRSTIKQYYEAEVKYEQEDKNIDNYYGLNTLRKMMDIVIGQRDIDINSKQELVARIRKAFLFLHSRLQLFRYYIRESSKYVNIPLLGQLQKELEEDIEQWNNTTLFFLKCSMRMTEEKYQKVIDDIRKLLETEERRYKTISGIYNIIL